MNRWGRAGRWPSTRRKAWRRTSLTATRGERGRFVEGGERPAPEVVGSTREAELRAAVKELGVRESTLLGFPDGGLDAVDPARVQRVIAEHLRRVRPQVVITFGPEGAYGHPDHIAISQLTTAAVVRAAEEGYAVSKLYYIAWSVATWAAYQTALKKLTSHGRWRRAAGEPDAGMGSHHSNRHERGVARRLARGAVPSHADEHLQEPRAGCRPSTIARSGACRSFIARSAS